MQFTFGVETVRWGVSDSGGWNCLPSYFWGGTGQAQGLPLQWWRGGSNTGGCHNSSNSPRRSGVRRGALRGESPRTREGRRPDRPTAVVGGQWSEAAALALLGGVDWLSLSRYRRRTKARHFFGLGDGRFPARVERPEDASFRGLYCGWGRLHFEPTGT